MTIPRSRARIRAAYLRVCRAGHVRRRRAYHRPVIRATSGRSVPRADQPGRPSARVRVRLEPLPEVAASRPIDVAEAFRDLPGLALLESARPGRNARWTYLTADPVAVLERRRPAAIRSPSARRLLGRLAGRRRTRRAGATRRRRRSSAGSSGTSATTSGHVLERLPTIAAGRPGPAASSVSRSTTGSIAWDRRTGAAWLGGRAVDGDGGRLDRGWPTSASGIRPGRATATSCRPSADVVRTLPTAARVHLEPRRPAYEAGVEAIRERDRRTATSTRPT